MLARVNSFYQRFYKQTIDFYVNFLNEKQAKIYNLFILLLSLFFLSVFGQISFFGKMFHYKLDSIFFILLSSINYGQNEEVTSISITTNRIIMNAKKESKPTTPMPTLSPAGVAIQYLEPIFTRATEVGNYREPLPLADIDKDTCDG